jgi:O-acetyl-ADP-ribose deacetylase (regulator of RNase III)
VIEESSGSLLLTDVDALVNTVNTVGVMGKGIALQFKRAYPANYRAYRAACERGEVHLGAMFVFDTAIKGPRRFIINFPTKRHWKSSSKLEDIASGLDDLVRVITELGLESVAIPALGCGNGGLAWSEVKPLIAAASARMPRVRTVVFPPTGAPPAVSMPNATPKPALNEARALLVVAVARYFEQARLQEVREGVSELEIQKLVYFLKALGAAYPLAFDRGHYGPYADRLPHVLDLLEGHYLIGFGDRSSRVTEFEPITPIAPHLPEAESVLDRCSPDRERLDKLLALVDGFETPYSLELLATVHFAATQSPPTADPTLIGDRVADWSLRKARLFTQDHVRVATRRLAERGLLPNTAPPARIPIPM